MIQLFKDLWTVLVERSQTRKAMRLLTKQEWSMEFLEAMLVRAAKHYNGPLQMTIVAPNGSKIVISTVKAEQKRLRNDDIFDKLNDDIAIRNFMESIK